jgi:hypothetical protein
MLFPEWIYRINRNIVVRCRNLENIKGDYMRIYVGFDDTDIVGSKRGTGKLARWFEKELPKECAVWGVVRQQLLVDERIPYTSHNSSACVVIDCPDDFSVDLMISRAIAHIESNYISGSDPGLCVCPENHYAIEKLILFGKQCATRIASQKEAMEAAQGIHLSGHGGTNDGIIGAAAGIGLTIYGWSGRFIEYGSLRDFPENVSVEDLGKSGIRVVSIDRDAPMPLESDMVFTSGWLRPRLIGSGPTVLVTSIEKNVWQAVGLKHRK